MNKPTIYTLLLSLFAFFSPSVFAIDCTNNQCVTITTLEWELPTLDIFDNPLTGSTALTGSRFTCESNVTTNTDPSTWSYIYDISDPLQTSIALNVLFSKTTTTELSCVIQYKNNDNTGKPDYSEYSNAVKFNRISDGAGGATYEGLVTTQQKTTPAQNNTLGYY